MGNTGGETRPGRSAGPGVSSGLGRVREVARKDKDARFTALLHHVTPGLLERSFDGLEEGRGSRRGRGEMAGLRARCARPPAVPARAGAVRGSTGRCRRGAFTSRRRTGGCGRSASRRWRTRFSSAPSAEVLNAVYEADFKGFSYGFRPGRSQHDALDALSVGLAKRVNWVLDADIRGFFDHLDRGWLVKFLRHRIADERILRLVMKWLNAGVLEDGQLSDSGEGTPQGGSLSPLLANVYLHYVLDLWADWWRKTQARGNVIIMRFADDFIVGFQYQDDAERFLEELRGRLAKFSPGAAPRQDPADRVRAARGPAAQGAGRGEAGDVHVPGIPAHRPDDQGAVLGPADHGQEEDDGQAEVGESRADAETASPRPRAGKMAGQRDSRARGVLRRPREREGSRRIPSPGHPPLAARARRAAARKAGSHWERMLRMARPLPASDQDQASMA